MKLRFFASGLLVAMVLAGCAGEPVKEEAPIAAAETPVASDLAQVPAETRPVPIDATVNAAQVGGGFTGHPLDDPQSPLSQRIFYFELDSNQISEKDREIISAHAAYLAGHPEISVVVEGHADERGSREYNLALGERRANAVENILSLLGATASQLQVISFGEERPVALGHNEEAWRLNRRVELLYSGY